MGLETSRVEKVCRMKYVIQTMMVISAILLVASIAFLAWRTERWFHYKMSYKAQVEAQIMEQISPLQAHILSLEMRVSNLETNR